MFAYFPNNSKELSIKESSSLTVHKQVFDKNKKVPLFFVLMFCFITSIIKIIGPNFSSTITQLNINQAAEANDFNTLIEPLQYTLIEWSAVIFALLPFIIALIDYRLHNDVATAIMGMAIFHAFFGLLFDLKSKELTC